MKVHIYPTIDPDAPDPGNGGIHRVVLGQYRGLPATGWEIVDSAAEADLIHCHVEVPPTYTRLYGDRPIVVSSHGLYWTDGGYDWENWCYVTNQKALHAIRVADSITAVSDWVAQAIRRNTMRPVHVVHNGVDADEWAPVEPGMRGGYVLWNKTRIDPICDPGPVNAAARLLPRVPFVSTFGDAAHNVEIVGRMAYADGAELVKRAGVYLATTRETWGIGTLEAMAAGVPVVGYRHGGQVEFIEHGVDGWLVTPGDVEGLAEGIEWALANRDRIGERARAKAQVYSIEAAAAQYARLYEHTYERFQRERSGPKVSVIVPAYKMGDYLDAALQSVAAQTLDDWECIVVNDASPDPRDQEIADRWATEDKRFVSLVLPENGYLAHARNAGIEEAHGRYIMPLDADDQLTPDTLATLSRALDATRDIDIAYGGVRFVDADGRTPTVYREAKEQGYSPGKSGWPVPFRLDWMLSRPGQLLPYASMYRRKVWEYMGGYRERCRTSEDQDFWLRTTSYGFIAQMVTDADTLIYRNRADSMSAMQGWANHRSWYPWVNDRTLLPAAAIQEGKEPRYMPVAAFDPAPVAVVIPVGPGHAPLLYDAVDSVDAQTMRNWECIVVNDTGEALPPLPSWVRVVQQEGYARYGGAAAARNAGIASTTAPLFLPLDADDYLQPLAIQSMMDNYLSGPEPAVIYSDFWEDPTGEMRIYQAPDYDPYALIRKGALHAVTALTPRRFWAEVGGYIEDVAWEDWAFALAVAGKGHCSRRVAMPLFVYRKHTGMRREQNMADFEHSKRAIMQQDFGAIGGELLACSRCPSGRSTTSMGYAQHTALRGATMAPPSGDAVLLRYTGDKAGDIPFTSRVDRRTVYRFSTNRPEGWVHKDDAEWLLGYDYFQRIDIATNGNGNAEPPMETEPLFAGRVPVGVATSGSAGSGTIPTGDVGAGMQMTTAPESATATTAVAEPPASDAEEEAAIAIADPDVQRLARASRDDLNAQAAQLGITGAETLRTKVDVAKAIVAYKRMMGMPL